MIEHRLVGRFFETAKSRNEKSTRHEKVDFDIPPELLKSIIEREKKVAKEMFKSSTYVDWISMATAEHSKEKYESEFLGYSSDDFFTTGEVKSYKKPKPKVDADKPQTQVESDWA